MNHGFEHSSNFWVNNVKSRRMVRRLLHSPDSCCSLSESRLREEKTWTCLWCILVERVVGIADIVDGGNMKQKKGIRTNPYLCDSTLRKIMPNSKIRNFAIRNFTSSHNFIMGLLMWSHANYRWNVEWRIYDSHAQSTLEILGRDTLT